MRKPHILLGVSGSIAVYKVCSLVSDLSKKGCDVRVILTRHASAFVPSLTFAALSGNDVYMDEFNGSHEAMIPHIELARWADLFLLVPADANILAKAAHGLADDLLSSCLLALTCPIVAAPAMNTHMYENPATQANLALLKSRGWQMIEPESGLLACKENGKGRLADPLEISKFAMDLLDPMQQPQNAKDSTSTDESSAPVPQNSENAPEDLPLAGLKVVVSAGPTQEALDPVRFLSNHSSGKQGFAIAKAAADLGAKVVLAAGPVSLATPEHVTRRDYVSARDLEAIMLEEAADADFVIMAAAVADYRFAHTSDSKIKKGDGSMQLELVRNPDILARLGQNKPANQILCGFAMETENLDANAKEKMEKKNCDLLIANSLRTKGAGFGGDTNIVTMMTPQNCTHLPIMSKETLGQTILCEMLALRKGK